MSKTTAAVISEIAALFFALFLFWPIFELFNLLGEGRFLACALGVWAMIFLGASLLAINRILGRKLGTLFRVS